MLSRALQANKIVSGVSFPGVAQSDPFTPPADSILVVRGSIEFDYTSGDQTAHVIISDSVGLTWIPIGSTFSPAYYCDATCGWYAFVGPAPVSMTVSISCDLPCNNTAIHNQVFSYTGYDPVTPIRQSHFESVGGLVGVGPNPWTVDFDMAPLPTSDCLAFLFVSSEISTPGTGIADDPYVDVINTPDTDNPHVMAATGIASTPVPWAATYTQTDLAVYQRSAMAVEVAAAAAAADGGIFPFGGL